MEIDPDDARVDRIDAWYERNEAVRKLCAAEKKHKDELSKLEEKNKVIDYFLPDLYSDLLKLKSKIEMYQADLEIILSKKE